MCHRLAQLGMEYAEAAQREGVRDLQPRPERKLAPHTYMPPSPPHIRDDALGGLFAIVSRCCRQAILLEARLDTAAFDQQPPLSIAPPAPAPERSAASPRVREPGDGTRLDHETLDDDLAADARRTPSEILADICQQLGHAIEAQPELTQVSPAAKPTVPAHTPHTPRRHPVRPQRPPEKPPPKPG